MNFTGIVEVVFALLALVLWGFVLMVALAVSRPARPAPGRAGMELGAESPAVVNLLAHRWALTEDAAEATLLDLAARRFLEFRQPGGDPMGTTVHLGSQVPEDGALRPYEQQVLDRVLGLLAGDGNGVVPLTALAFPDPAQARAWTRRLHASIIVEARRLGLSRRRFGSTATAVLLAACVVGGIGVWVAAVGVTGRQGNASTIAGAIAGAATFVLLRSVVFRLNGDRETEAGRSAAVRWLGVGEWLRAHDRFADVPPASVMVWDRYLGYGAALGVTHRTSTILDLGAGSRRGVWSFYGGAWHRVRLRYPVASPHRGKEPRDPVAQPVAETATDDNTQALVARMLGDAAPEVFTAEDVAMLLGLPVIGEEAGAVTRYRPASGGAVMAVAATMVGHEAQSTWTSVISRGALVVPGVRDGACLERSSAYVMDGDFLTTLTLVGPGRPRAVHLGWLMQRLTGRRLRRDVDR